MRTAINWFLILSSIWIFTCSLSANETPISQEKFEKFKVVIQQYEDELKEDPANYRLAIALGDAYYTFKDYPQAIKYYKLVLVTQPDDTAVKISLANAYLANFDKKASEQLFLEVRAAEPRNIDAYIGLGRLEALNYNFKQAQDFYNQALKINPNNTTLRYYLADLKIDLKEFAEAEKLLEALKKENPKYTWIARALDRAKAGPVLEDLLKLEDQKNYKLAIARYKEEIEKNKDNIDFYLGLARVYTLAKDPSKSVAILHQAMNVDPTSNAINQALGAAYMASGNFIEAKKYFDASLKKSINDAESLSSLGKLHLMIGDEETAENYYKIALKDNSASIIALSSLANLKIRQGKTEEGKELYEKLLKKHPEASFAERILQDLEFDALIKKMQNRLDVQEEEEVGAQVKKFIDTYPKRVNYYIKLGHVYNRKNEYQEAILLYLAGLKAVPASVELKLELANTYLKRGDYIPAKDLFEEILKADPADSEAIAGLGRIEELEGRKKESRILYTRALQKNPYSLTALNYLANLLIEEQLFDQAREVLEKIKKVDPTADWVNDALRDVKYGPILREIKLKTESKDVKGVGPLYDQLIKLEPKVPDYYLRAARFYHHEKRYDKAVEMYLEAGKLDPENSNLWAGLGLVYLSKHEYKDAAKVFKRSLRLNPENADALAGLGSVEAHNKNLKKADNLIRRALDIAPDLEAVLSSLGNLRMLQKDYKQAAEVYLRLLKLHPKEEWIKRAYENAINGKELDLIDRLIKEKLFQEAKERYERLVEKYPDNAGYYSGVGLMNLRLRKYAEATNIYLDAIERNPEELELIVSLGYSYLLAKKWNEALPVLKNAVQQDPKNAEALAGLGRVYAELGVEGKAEEYYIKALEYKHDNQSALSFYAMMLMKQKRFAEAVNIVERLQFELPDEDWVLNLLKDAEDGPVLEVAKNFSNEEQYEDALGLYAQLLESSPNDPARYELLGSMYVNLYDYWGAIAIYEQGLAIDSDAHFLRRAIAFAYIYLEEYCLALEIFNELLELDPEDAESLAGLGRIEALAGCWDIAEQYFMLALSLAPENTTVLGLYADLKRAQGHYCEALMLYEQMLEINDRPKWIRTAEHEMLNKTMPTITILGGSHVEKEWDSSVHRNSAKYRVQGAGALINYPICCDLDIWGKMYDEYFELRDLLTRKIIYSFDTERAHIGFRRIYCTDWIIDMQLGISNYSRYRHGTSDAQQGTIFEPGIRFTYQQPQLKASAALWSDSTIIARNFNRNVSKLVGRYFLNTTYEQQVMQRGWAGVDLNASYYNDYVDNSSASALGWFQWRPPIYTNNIVFRYHMRLGTFSENIPDYYTYKAQIVNYFQVTFEKYWRICWADSFYTSLALGHGFQNTLTKFAQFIVLNPSANNKLRWDNREYNIAIFKTVYKWDQLQASLILDHYRDTERYTMSSILGELTWRF